MRDYARLYSQLLSDLEFDSCPPSVYYSDYSPEDAAKVSLANSFYKKLCPLGNTKTADKAALEKFLDINRSITELPFEFVASNEVESCFWDYFKHHLNMCLEPHESLKNLDLDFIREHMGPGPGAAQKADSSTLHTKLFEGEMSYYNQDMIRLYRAAIVETGFWCDAEMRRFQKYGFTIVRGNKIFFAPKNAEISRVCGTEANLECLLQKAIGRFLEYRAEKYFGINLSTQPEYNRKLARKGSIDGSIGTIDLVSASDYISLSLLNAALEPGKLKYLILATRSGSAVLPDGSEEKLRMVSTMGNGFTFPLQTIIFASVVRACYQLMGIPSNCPRTEFGVFGDDICVHSRAYEFVCQMLTKIGFKVNVGKSFNSGPFRESCGEDYHFGSNIRGVYIKSLETPQQVYSAINRLNRWAARHGVRINSVMQTLYSWVRDIRTPLSESDDAGIHVPFVLTRPKVDNAYWFKYRAYVRRRSAVKQPEPDDIQATPFNPDGIAVGILSGSLRRRDVVLTNPLQLDWTDDSAWKHDWSLSYSLRDRMGVRARYQIVNRNIPYWDWVPDTTMEPGPVWDDERRVPLTRDSHEAWVSLMVDTLKI